MERYSATSASASSFRKVAYERRKPLTYTGPGKTSKSSVSRASKYLPRILVRPSTSLMLRPLRIRASRKLLPISIIGTEVYLSHMACDLLHKTSRIGDRVRGGLELEDELPALHARPMVHG